VKKILTALAITTGLLLTGCSNVDSALSFGETEITTAELQAKVDTLLAEREKVESGEDLLRNQLQFQLLIQGFAVLGEELKIEVSNSEIAARRAAIVEQVGGEEQIPSALVSAAVTPEDFEPYLRGIIISEKMVQTLIQTGVPEAEVQTRVQELFVTKLNSLNIAVNPRYGTWDPESGQIVAAVVAGDAVTPSAE
jgi:outer membrane murein-binding lipoprotein Lpp